MAKSKEKIIAELEGQLDQVAYVAEHSTSKTLRDDLKEVLGKENVKDRAIKVGIERGEIVPPPEPEPEEEEKGKEPESTEPEGEEKGKEPESTEPEGEDPEDGDPTEPEEDPEPE